MAILQTFEHNGRQLQLATYESESSSKPAKTSSTRAPGAGKFEIWQIDLSTHKISAGEELILTTQVSGKHIAYIYSEILFQDSDPNQFYGPIARDYIQAEANKTTGGISRPSWGETINLTVRLRPSLRLLTDGVNSAFGFLLPEGYDRSTYHIDGLYTSADGATTHRARMAFDSLGETANIVAYKERKASAAPHALTMKQGDQFTPFIQILNPPTDENPTWQVTTGLSTTLTLGNQPLRWEEAPLLPGTYLIGLLVQDLDGGLTRRYSSLTVGE